MSKTLKTRLVTLLGLFLFLATDVMARDQESGHYDFGPGQLLKMNLRTGGSISIEGWDRSGIQISYGDRRRGVEDYDIEIVDSAEGLSIETSLRDREGSSNLKFSIRAPRELVLDFYTAGGGLTLDGVIGEFSGKTGGGALNLTDVTGQVDLRTGGGQIRVLDSMVDGRVQTGGGKVLVEDVTGDLRATSGGGDVRYKNVRSSDGKLLGPKRIKLDDATEESVLISSAGGRIKVDSAPDGASVYTGGGGVQVRGADRFVAASTGGGDVDIELLEGWVDASTGAGEIEVKIERDTGGKGDIKVVSGLGDIYLTLPDGFSMDLDVELGVTNNTRKQFSIQSDFDVDIEQTDKWDYSKGTPRKFVYGNAVLGGGDHRVMVRTTNGNVVIRKTRAN
jgi:DUF4097 and DUF4098 domain-containing protein YvlB